MSVEWPLVAMGTAAILLAAIRFTTHKYKEIKKSIEIEIEELRRVGESSALECADYLRFSVAYILNRSTITHHIEYTKLGLWPWQRQYRVVIKLTLTEMEDREKAECLLRQVVSEFFHRPENLIYSAVSEISYSDSPTQGVAR